MSFQSKTVSSSVYYNIPMDEAFGFASVKHVNPHLDILGHVAVNPFLGFAQQGFNTTTSLNVAPGVKVKVGSFNGVQQQNDAQVSGFVSEISFTENSWLDTSMQFGFMNEKGSFLGAYTSGAFNMDEGTPTWFSAVASNYDLSEHSNVYATFSMGISMPQAKQGDDSVFEGFSGIASSSFSVGMTSIDVMQAGDKAGFSISQPLRKESGYADIRSLYARDQAGHLYYDTSRYELPPSGRELDISTYYEFAIDKALHLSTSATLRHEPNHIADAKEEGVFMVKGGWQF